MNTEYTVTQSPFGVVVSDTSGEILAVVSRKLPTDTLMELLDQLPAVIEPRGDSEQAELFPA